MVPALKELTTFMSYWVTLPASETELLSSASYNTKHPKKKQERSIH